MARQILKDPYLRQVRDDFHLRTFITEDDARRAIYFEGIDHAIRSWTSWLGEPPPDDLLIDSLFVAVQRDETFNEFVVKRSDAEFRSNPDVWPGLIRAMAGTILQVYVRACETGDWPGV